LRPIESDASVRMMPATLSIERTSGLGHTAAAGAPSEAMSGAADVEEEEEPASAAGARLLNIANTVARLVRETCRAEHLNTRAAFQKWA
jgi:hypothetical protein